MRIGPFDTVRISWGISCALDLSVDVSAHFSVPVIIPKPITDPLAWCYYSVSGLHKPGGMGAESDKDKHEDKRLKTT